MTKNIKAGTRIEVIGHGLDWSETREGATIMRWNTKRSGPREDVPGYHRVKFDNGGILLCHEESFEIVAECAA